MATLDLFRHADDAESYAAGQYIFAKGDPGEIMYAVVEGEIQILVDGQVIDRVGPGGIFGEMALIDNSPRSGSAMAAVDSKLVPISKKRFLFLVQQTPFFSLDVMSIMAERLRRLMSLHGQTGVQG
jgi:CRP/FNR family transcriptional regulator, cyclic AMP receptor protein